MNYPMFTYMYLNGDFPCQERGLFNIVEHFGWNLAMVTQHKQNVENIRACQE